MGRGTLPGHSAKKVVASQDFVPGVDKGTVPRWDRDPIPGVDRGRTVVPVEVVDVPDQDINSTVK